MLPHRGGRARFPPRRIPPLEAGSSQQSQGSPILTNTYEPTPVDCLKVKSLLTKATNFPPEIVDMIMDSAEYWACSVSSIDYTGLRIRQHIIYGGRPNENEMLVSRRITPICVRLFKCCC